MFEHFKMNYLEDCNTIQNPIFTLLDIDKLVQPWATPQPLFCSVTVYLLFQVLTHLILGHCVIMMDCGTELLVMQAMICFDFSAKLL